MVLQAYLDSNYDGNPCAAYGMGILLLSALKFMRADVWRYPRKRLDYRTDAPEGVRGWNKARKIQGYGKGAAGRETLCAPLTVPK